jgi:hypothetical protein
MDQAKRGPSPWLAPTVAIISIVVVVVWAYIQMRHWKEPGIDAMALALHIGFTLLLWTLLIVGLVLNLRDAYRAKSLLAQIATVKNESEAQIALFKGLADQERQKAEIADGAVQQATKERSEFQGRAYGATQELSGCNQLIADQISIIHRLERESAEYARLAGLGIPKNAPDRLRGYVSTLAGSLFSMLVEIGEKLEAPILTSDQYGNALFGNHPPDPRITARATERKITDRLRDAYLYARDIGVLPECVSWSASVEDVGEVRARIGELKILSEALMRRFPDLPAIPTDLSVPERDR